MVTRNKVGAVMMVMMMMMMVIRPGRVPRFLGANRHRQYPLAPFVFGCEGTEFYPGASRNCVACESCSV